MQDIHFAPVNGKQHQFFTSSRVRNAMLAVMRSPITDTDYLEAYAVHNRNDGYFFSPNNMKAFRTKVSDTAYKGPAGFLFVTRDRTFNGGKGWTVRQCWMGGANDGHITRVADMGDFDTETQALRFAAAFHVAADALLKFFEEIHHDAAV